MKKKIIIGVLLITLLVAVFFLNGYYHPISDIDKLEISRVTEYEINAEDKDVTDLIETNTLRKILPLISCKRVSESRRHLNVEDIKYEIKGKYNNESICLTIGNSEGSYIYKVSDKRWQKIRNPEILAEIIDDLK